MDSTCTIMKVSLLDGHKAPGNMHTLNSCIVLLNKHSAPGLTKIKQALFTALIAMQFSLKKKYVSKRSVWFNNRAIANFVNFQDKVI